MANKILTWVYLVFIVFTLNSCSQTPYDTELVSDDKELSFLSSETKRGIRSEDGTVYFVQSDGLTLTAYRGNVVKWTVTFTKLCTEPTIKKSDIQYIRLKGDTIQLIFFRRNFALVDVRDGRTIYRCGD